MCERDMWWHRLSPVQRARNDNAFFFGALRSHAVWTRASNITALAFPCRTKWKPWNRLYSFLFRIECIDVKNISQPIRREWGMCTCMCVWENVLIFVGIFLLLLLLLFLVRLTFPFDFVCDVQPKYFCEPFRLFNDESPLFCRIL